MNVSDELLIGVTIGLTSGIAYLLGRRLIGLPRRGLSAAVTRTLECLGITAVFVVFNGATGILVVLGLRKVTGQFVGLYAFTDIVLIPLSLMQGLLFWWWRVASGSADGS
jgi:hypothetical protein